MESSKIKSLVGLTATATATIMLSNFQICSQSYQYDFVDDKKISATSNQLTDRVTLNDLYDHYQVVQNVVPDYLNQVESLHSFAAKVLDNLKDIDPDFSEIVDDNFWDLV